MKSFAIPSDINKWPRPTQISYYLDCGLLLQPVYGPGAAVKDAGKRPRLTLEERLALTRDQVLAWFGNGSPDNVGQIPRRPHVSIDLDDKSPDCRALRAFWMLEPDLANIPRVRSHRGVHLHFLCNDIPADISTLKTINLLPGLNAELFCDPACNIILPPSVHPSGIRYEWEGTGIIPLIPWTELQRIFKFKVDAEHCHKSSEWKRQFRGDLRTLDLVALCTQLGIYGQELSRDEGKHSVKCPWKNEHTTGDAWTPNCTETVIYMPAGKTPSFKCLHAHCSGRTIAELLSWAESRQAGVVDRFCRLTYQPNTRTADGPDGLGKARPYLEQEERETECPYPPVDWSDVAINAPKGFMHQAFYPKDTLLDEWLEFGSTVSEASNGVILGTILPVVAAELQRRVWIPWYEGPAFPNLYSLLIGSAGDGKNTVVNWVQTISRACLDANAFLNLVNVSPQGLFEQYYEPAGGNPDKLSVFTEGNIVLRGWVETTIGGAVAAQLLDLYDCKPYTETYVRNKKENDGNATRTVDETSTSMLLSGTFNVAHFNGVQQREGLDRRFLNMSLKGRNARSCGPLERTSPPFAKVS
jgi:hypothetical protein